MAQTLASITVDSSSTLSSAEFNPFDEDSHAAFASTANVTASGITYTQADGRFTCDDAGTYRVWGMLLVTTLVGGPALMTLQIKVNGSTRYTVPGFGVHNAQAPTFVPFGILLTLTAGQFFELTLTEDAATTIGTTPGTTMNIVRVS